MGPFLDRAPAEKPTCSIFSSEMTNEEGGLIYVDRKINSLNDIYVKNDNIG
jgi:hypothetical protein